MERNAPQAIKLFTCLRPAKVKDCLHHHTHFILSGTTPTASRDCKICLTPSGAKKSTDDDSGLSKRRRLSPSSKTLRRMSFSSSVGDASTGTGDHSDMLTAADDEAVAGVTSLCCISSTCSGRSCQVLNSRTRRLRDGKRLASSLTREKISRLEPPSSGSRNANAGLGTACGALPSKRNSLFDLAGQLTICVKSSSKTSVGPRTSSPTLT